MNGGNCTTIFTVVDSDTAEFGRGLSTCSVEDRASRGLTMEKIRQSADATQSGFLQRLIGMPLVSIDRALNMAMFGFGEMIQREDGKGETRTAREYALHVQCA